MSRLGVLAIVLVGCSDVRVVPSDGGGDGPPTADGSSSHSGAATSASAATTTSSTAAVATVGASTSGGAGGAGGEGGAGGSAGAPVEIERPCNRYQVADCGNTLDDDDDGLVDAFDPDCLGPCDWSEDSWRDDHPGSYGPRCVVDCFWDSSAGSADDGCPWSHRCDPTSVAPWWGPTGDRECAHDPATTRPGTGLTCDEMAAASGRACAERCGPLIPNGCDAFGCCELPPGSGVFRSLGSHGLEAPVPCSASTIDDPTVCRPCTPVAPSFNPCDPCELCVGGELPDDGCTEAEQCPGGEPACGRPEQPLCPPDTYCITGCCQPTPTMTL